MTGYGFDGDHSRLRKVLTQRMTNGKLSQGVTHVVPVDLRTALTMDSQALAAWENLTPLARNEWICWVTFVQKEETRKEHIKRLINELKEGKRRPCCWMGCTHRKDKAISPSVRYVLSKMQSKGTRRKK